MTIAEAARQIRDGKLSCVELLNQCRKKIEALEPQLNAFIELRLEEAEAQARQLDYELAQGHWRGPLHGIPVAVKDVFCTRQGRTTAGSKIFAGYQPGYDATVVERLLTAGAVLVGKTNLHELAYGITSSNPHFGPVRNPWDPARIPGGSSGGSAVATSAGMVFMALGTDTGGSIRIPASFCGLVGLKPTYGLVSRFGMLPLGWTLDHVGPLARSVNDAALVLEVIAGHDPRDPYSARRTAALRLPVDCFGFEGLRLGVPRDYFWERLEPAVASALEEALEVARAEGATLVEVDWPDARDLTEAGRLILLAEAASVFEPYIDQKELFGKDVWLLLQQGRLLPATAYLQAQRFRAAAIQHWKKVWQQVDVVVTPTTPVTAPRIGQQTVLWTDGTEEDVRLAATRLVRAFNALGVPALSIPCGQDPQGLPIGMQLVGSWFAEDRLLAVGRCFERALGYEDWMSPAA